VSADEVGRRGHPSIVDVRAGVHDEGVRCVRDRGALTAADLADDVGRLGVGFEVRVHLQPHDDPGAAVGEALQAVAVFGRDRGGRNFRRVVRVLERAGVGRSQPGRSHRAHQRGDGAVARGSRRAGGAEPHGPRRSS